VERDVHGEPRRVSTREARGSALDAVERAAIGHYHDLLAADDALAEETQAALDDMQRRRRLVFGDRPLATVLRPRFTTHDAQRRLEGQMRPLLRAFARALDAALGDPALLAQFHLVPWERELVRHDPGFRAASPTSRLDAFVIPSTGAMAITEYNAETPAGAAYTDALADVFVDIPAMRALARTYSLMAPPCRPGVLRSLLDAYRQWKGGRAAPRIVILDWREVPTYREFELFEEYFHSRGLSCVIADPRNAEYRNGTLYCDGHAVDLIYKRVLLSELVERGGVDHPVIRAVRDGAACMVNPFRCKILHKKASLAVLSDDANASLFERDELAAIAAHVPWTRVVEERATTYDGKRVDLLDFVTRNRERLVLKPNDEYGGTGIVLGWETSGDEWEGAMKVALATPHIVQERVAIPREPYPSFADGRAQVIERMVDTAPFVSDGAYTEGALARLSTAALLNVTAGGGSSIPTFIVERR
jgi:uncharacterized circularly permuted ATP-grasp superfamily protein